MSGLGKRSVEHPPCWVGISVTSISYIMINTKLNNSPSQEIMRNLTVERKKNVFFIESSVAVWELKNIKIS
jgi:hypothetical protein